MRTYLRVPLRDWLWLGLLSLWRLWIADQRGLGVDEAHYVLYGMHLDWSYFDHPPLIGWIHAVLLHLLGRHDWVARLPAVICGLVSSIFIYRLALAISDNARIARWITIAVNSCFLLAGLWIMCVPDTILLMLALWLVEIATAILQRSSEVRWKDWMKLGICLGLCGLTKYNAVFFIPALAVLSVSEHLWTRHPFMRILPKALGAMVLASVLVAPVFWWNWQHQWISFVYQHNHVMGWHPIQLSLLGLFLVGQLGCFGPFLIVAATVGLAAATRARQIPLPARVSLWLAAPTLAFFAYSSLREAVLPHWTLVFWGLALPVGLALSLQYKGMRRWSLIAIVLSALITAGLYAELTFSFLRFPAWQSPYADLTGWQSLHKELDHILKSEVPGSYSIAVPNWTLGSRAHYYLEDLAPVYVLDDRFDQFDLWEHGEPKTENVLILQWRGFTLQAEKAKLCRTLEPLESKVFSEHGRPVTSVDLIWCRGFKPSDMHFQSVTAR